MYKKIYSECICLGFAWGIFAWINFFKHSDIPSKFTSLPVFLSIGLGKVLIKKTDVLYDKNIFVISVLCGGFIGYIIALIIINILTAIRED